jgi:hypothetical protein
MINNLQLLGAILLALCAVCIAMALELRVIAKWIVEQIKGKK